MLDRAMKVQDKEVQFDQQLAMNPNAPTPEGMLGVEAPQELPQQPMEVMGDAQQV
jgi:hypothetical protein